MGEVEGATVHVMLEGESGEKSMRLWAAEPRVDGGSAGFLHEATGYRQCVDPYGGPLHRRRSSRVPASGLGLRLLM